jgi:hypothetical protein
MATTIRNLLETVEWRLEETIVAFTVMQVINENCNADVNPALHKAINERGGFWKPVTVGLQTTVITGINAILDERSSDSATLYLVFKRLKMQLPPSFPQSFKNDIDTIRNRYKKFRHKLFGHNDIKREAIANEFDQAGFTWNSIAADLGDLEYAFKVLWHVEGGQPIPDKTSATRIIYPCDMSIARTKEHTVGFLGSLAV